jgi:hypothetical protein
MAERTQVSFKCELCGKSHLWKPHLSGKKAQCSCGHVMRVPEGPTGLAVKTPKRKRDRSFALVEDDAPTSAESRAGGSSASRGDTWKWWYYIVAGALIGLYSLYEIAFNLNFQRTIGGLFIAALAICVGLWSKPHPIAEGGPRSLQNE